MNASEALFLLAFALWMVFQLLDAALVGSVISGPILKAVRYGCVGLLLISELLGGRYDRRTLAWVVIAWIVCIGMLNSGQAFYIDCVLFVFCARNMPLDKILKVAFWVSTIMFVLIMLCSFVGILPNILYTAGNRPRYLLGFRYPLFPSMIIFNITCIVILLKRERFGLLHAALLVISNAVIYAATDSRLSFYLALAAIVAALCCAYAKTGRLDSSMRWLRSAVDSKPFECVTYAIFPVCAIFMLAVTIAFTPENPILNSFDSTLGGRLWLGHDAVEAYGFTLFGQEITQIGGALDATGAQQVYEAYNYIDSLYVKLFVQIGIIPAIAFFGAFTALTVWAYRTRKWFLLITLIALALHFTIDDLSLSLRYDTVLLFMSLPLRAPADSVPAWPPHDTPAPENVEETS